MNEKTAIRVRDVMHNRFFRVDGMTTVDQALRRLKESRATVLIIQKRDEHDEHGLVLLADIARKVLSKNRAPDRVNVYEIMNKPALAVRPDMQVKYCARLLDQFDLTTAPVIDSAGEVIGIVDYDHLVMGGLADLDEQ